METVHSHRCHRRTKSEPPLRSSMTFQTTPDHNPVRWRPTVGGQSPNVENGPGHGANTSAKSTKSPRVFELCVRSGPPPVITPETINMLKRVCKEELFLYKYLDHSLTGLELTPEEQTMLPSLELLAFESPGLAGLLGLEMGYYLRRASTTPGGVSEEQKTAILRGLSFTFPTEPLKQLKKESPGADGDDMDELDKMKLVFFRREPKPKAVELPKKFRCTQVPMRSIGGLSDAEFDPARNWGVEDLKEVNVSLKKGLTPFNHT